MEYLIPHGEGQQKKKEMPLNGRAGTQPKQQRKADKNGRITLRSYAPYDEASIKIKLR